MVVAASVLSLNQGKGVKTAKKMEDRKFISMIGNLLSRARSFKNLYNIFSLFLFPFRSTIVQNISPPSIPSKFSLPFIPCKSIEWRVSRRNKKKRERKWKNYPSSISSYDIFFDEADLSSSLYRMKGHKIKRKDVEKRNKSTISINLSSIIAPRNYFSLHQWFEWLNTE